MSTKIYINPCHLPCPDLEHYSLTKEDKERGLIQLAKVRKEFAAKRAETETLRERRKRLWLEKLKQKSLRLPNRVIMPY
ncbi:hypothetical protein [Vibrio sagamiensis]|uniref:Uncharacterized protein n=1 Tax=Vibrio sagamiensis NBRC 104589 TaxID=1219064 RepID=A0A511QJS1_9VIBR|nr:hypothetical protein [Vibrio sagamiensis]PNQ54424.1 hypothetical protein C1141_15975 [Vibrio agarivorans]GEM77578.1 hypothetical protein VSA01S_36900 [Vibrio sagamiensis NBRC 104589]